MNVCTLLCVSVVSIFHPLIRTMMETHTHTCVYEPVTLLACLWSTSKCAVESSFLCGISENFYNNYYCFNMGFLQCYYLLYFVFVFLGGLLLVLLLHFTVNCFNFDYNNWKWFLCFCLAFSLTENWKYIFFSGGIRCVI